jgi:hypothetical protein
MVYPERAMLTRKDAAAYLTERYFRVSVSTLNRRACEGNGPRYVCRGERAGGEAFYKPADLDRWARQWLKAPERRPRQIASAT